MAKATDNADHGLRFGFEPEEARKIGIVGPGIISARLENEASRFSRVLIFKQERETLA